jgi:hypothetical protein
VLEIGRTSAAMILMASVQITAVADTYYYAVQHSCGQQQHVNIYCVHVANEELLLSHQHGNIDAYLVHTQLSGSHFALSVTLALLAV